MMSRASFDVLGNRRTLNILDGIFLVNCMLVKCVYDMNRVSGVRRSSRNNTIEDRETDFYANASADVLYSTDFYANASADVSALDAGIFHPENCELSTCRSNALNPLTQFKK